MRLALIVGGIARGLTCATLLFAPLVYAQTAYHLIPMPREITGVEQVPLNSVTVECAGCDAEDLFAANDLRETLADRGIPTGVGLRIVLRRLAEHPDASFTEEMRAEGYTIRYAAKTLTLTGATAEGLFYAAQTAKQMIERWPLQPVCAGVCPGFVLHAAEIHDWPAMRYRGLHDDLSRGPVDTLEFQKKLIRTLAAYKINVYSPYFENTQQYASNPLPAPPEGSISAEDARALVAYATQYHIIVIPEQEAIGHLRKMLQWETYADVAETPHGAVLSPGQAGSIPLIDAMFKELAAMYPGPFLHIGGDETIDLGIGRTRVDVDTRGLPTVYIDYLKQIVTSLEPLHKKILFWGDVAQSDPELLKELPPEIKHQLIAVAWGYTPKPKGFLQELKPYTAAGIPVWVSPSINNYRQVWPNQQLALDDIQEFTRDGQKYGATGQLNTLWNDDGESLANMNWYGILFGAAAAWQRGESSIPAFQQSFAQVFHGDSLGLLNQAQGELTGAMTLLHDSKVIGATEGTDGLFWVDPWSKDGQVMAEKMRPINSEVRLYAERALKYIAQAKAQEPNLREPDAIAAMEFGARRIDFLGLKFQLADEMVDGYAQAQGTAMGTVSVHPVGPRPSVSALLSDINGVNGRLQDIIDGYSQLREMFEQQWDKTYRPSGLRPVLEHYDYTIAQWYARVDKVRSAQRQWSQLRTLPLAGDLGMPAVAQIAPTVPGATPTTTPAATPTTTTVPATPPPTAAPDAPHNP
ncbi:family 20 glycosylhydrolase [Granulicella sp. L46]|uniref:family 20 glycosylhydrolase n=1 Tax=Granulicella sp. L46 TaxID=1641865 RepID=UPI00131CAFA7|nr:family 20 glycosylhydrolase [Granulicella sp. L46]